MSVPVLSLPDIPAAICFLSLLPPPVSAGIIEGKEVEPQSIADDTEAGQAHGSSPEHGIQLPAEEGNPDSRCQGNADHIIEKCPKEVLVNIAQGSPAEADGRRYIAKPTLHQNNIRCINGDICACPNGDPHIGPGQSRSVIDAISHHGHLAFFLQSADHCLLALRSYPCNDLIHTGLGSDGFGSALIVTRQHHHPDSHILQLPDGLGTVFLDDIRHCQDTDESSVTGEEQGSFSIFCILFCLFLRLGRNHRLFPKEEKIASGQLPALPDSRQAIAGKGLEILRFSPCQPPFLCQGQNGASQGMLTSSLQSSSHFQQFFFSHPLRRTDIRHFGLTLGNGSRLIQGDNLHFPSLFQGAGGFEHDTMPSSQAITHHNSNRGGQAQGTGTADDQNRNSPGQGKAHFLPCQKPNKKGQKGDEEDCRNENAGHPVGYLGNRSLGSRRITDHLNDLGKSSILSHPCSLTAKVAGLVDGGSGYLIPHLLVHRYALPSQSRLIDGTGSLQNQAVHRDILPRSYHKLVADPDLLNPNLGFLALPQNPGCLGSQLHQTLQGIGGFSLGVSFQHLAHGNKGQDHGGRFKIKLMHIGHHRLAVLPHLGICHGKKHIETIAKGSPGTQGHQSIHIGSFVKQALEAADEKSLVNDHHRHGQQKLNQPHSHMIPL